MIKLYDFELSGNAYKARLFLKLLNVPHQLISVDLVNGEHKSPAFLEMNPKGQVPVLVDGDVVINDSQAILVYLATRYGGEAWSLADAATAGEIQFWLSTASNEIARGPADARLVKIFGAGLDFENAVNITNQILPVIEQHLSKNQFLVGNKVSIADLAVFPYLGLIGDAGLNLDAYPNINQWLERLQQVPGYVALPSAS